MGEMLRTFIFLLAITYVPLSHAGENKINFGVGVAERYAGLGLEFEYSFNEIISASFATGYSGKVGGAVGLNWYLIRPNKKYQIRLSGFYGRVSSANADIDGYRETKIFNGLSVGAGLKWEHFEFTFFYSDISKYNDFSTELRSLGVRTKNIDRLGLSFGYLF